MRQHPAIVRHLASAPGNTDSCISCDAAQVFTAAQELADHLGKQTCISQDRPGFIVNRVLMPMINEAFYTLMEVRLLLRTSLITQQTCAQPLRSTLLPSCLTSLTEGRAAMVEFCSRRWRQLLTMLACCLHRVWAQQRTLTGA